jgi:hypothetical protein
MSWVRQVWDLGPSPVLAVSGAPPELYRCTAPQLCAGVNCRQCYSSHGIPTSFLSNLSIFQTCRNNRGYQLQGQGMIKGAGHALSLDRFVGLGRHMWEARCRPKAAVCPALHAAGDGPWFGCKVDTAFAITIFASSLNHV